MAECELTDMLKDPQIARSYEGSEIHLIGFPPAHDLGFIISFTPVAGAPPALLTRRPRGKR